MNRKTDEPFDLKGFFNELRAQRISLSVDGDRLRLRAPAGVLTDELKAQLRAHRDDLIALLQSGEVAVGDNGSDLSRAQFSNDKLPLSYAQQRLWFLEKVNSGSNAYVIGAATRIIGRFEVDLMLEAFHEISRRHEALRTRFGEVDGEPFAEVLEDLKPSLSTTEFPGLTQEERDQKIQTFVAEKMGNSFDLFNGPLFAAEICRFDEDDHVLIIQMHHIVSDGMSMAVISRELQEVYSALLEDRKSVLPPVKAHWPDHAIWEQKRVSNDKWRGDIEFWLEELAGAPSLTELPTDRPYPDQPSYKGKSLTLNLDQKMCADLYALARQYRATLFNVLLASFQVLLRRHSGQDEILIGIPVTNRMDYRFENTIGCLINNVVVRGELVQDLTFTAFLDQIRGKVLSAHDHSEPPFDVVVDELKPERTTAYAPVCQVLFTLMSFPEFDQSVHGTTQVNIPVDTGATRFDLSLEIIERNGKLQVRYEYSTDLFDEETVQNLHRRYEALLNSIIAEPEGRISELNFISDVDQSTLSDLAVSRTAKIKDNLPTNRLIDIVAAEHPDKQAVVSGDVALDYKTLVERANGLASKLVASGVKPRDLVAVALDPSCDLIVALLAVWKAGAAYVPLDPHHPAERLAIVLEDADPAILITTSDLSEGLPGIQVPKVLLDREPIALADQSPDVATSSEDLAYVIYTSGSTGRPKGVEVEHRNLVAFLAAMQLEPGLEPSDRVLSVTTPSFDIAGLEYWLPLTLGATTVISDRAQRLDGSVIASILESQRISVMQATPATWQLLVDSGWAGMLRLKALCGGEALPTSLAEALVPKVGSLWNMYGPTETTIWSTVQKIETAEDAACIGQPIQNTRIAVMDQSGRPLPPGVIGELCIAGDGVARGYRNRPELTADRFTTLEFPDTGPVRAYRTGDLVRQRNDGGLVYIGRNDFQVKIRGFRIELGEIETQLAKAAGVGKCVVAAYQPKGKPMALVAYVVPDDDGAFSADNARATLRASLPEYMVPSWFVELDALPLTPNLKVDRNALPRPESSSASASVPVGDETAMSETERQVAALWREVLDLQAVGLDQSFFDVGGHSMLLIKLHEKLTAKFGDKIALIDLFRFTTVSSQAGIYDGIGTHTNDAAIARARQRAEKYENV